MYIVKLSTENTIEAVKGTGNLLKDIKQIVEGHVQVVPMYFFDNPHIKMLCNEDYRNKPLPFNSLASLLYKELSLESSYVKNFTPSVFNIQGNTVILREVIKEDCVDIDYLSEHEAKDIIKYLSVLISKL